MEAPCRRGKIVPKQGTTHAGRDTHAGTEMYHCWKSLTALSLTVLDQIEVPTRNHTIEHFIHGQTNLPW